LIYDRHNYLIRAALGVSGFDMEYSAGTLSREKLMRCIHLYGSKVIIPHNARAETVACVGRLAKAATIETVPV
jgi:hypothetical protein